MTYENKIKLARFIMALIIGGLGAWTVYVWSNGWVVIGIVLMIWSNNIERETFKE